MQADENDETEREDDKMGEIEKCTASAEKAAMWTAGEQNSLELA